jgi:contact-dependent growth inhibition (CDI) system restriction endonuclease-like protein
VVTASVKGAAKATAQISKKSFKPKGNLPALNLAQAESRGITLPAYEKPMIGATSGQGLPMNYETLVDAGITWGRGIHRQGMPWENYLEKLMPMGSRLPKNHNVFDFRDRVTWEAVSAKTLDTTTSSRLVKPERVYYTLKKSIDAAVNFEKSNLLRGVSKQK